MFDGDGDVDVDLGSPVGEGYDVIAIRISCHTSLRCLTPTGKAFPKYSSLPIPTEMWRPFVE